MKQENSGVFTLFVIKKSPGITTKNILPNMVVATGYIERWVQIKILILLYRFKLV
jgi:hypothetical protein